MPVLKILSSGAEQDVVSRFGMTPSSSWTRPRSRQSG